MSNCFGLSTVFTAEVGRAFNSCDAIEVYEVVADGVIFVVNKSRALARSVFVETSFTLKDCMHESISAEHWLYALNVDL